MNGKQARARRLARWLTAQSAATLTDARFHARLNRMRPKNVARAWRIAYPAAALPVEIAPRAARGEA